MNTYIAKTFYGLEEILVKELTDLGAENIKPLTRGVEFSGDQGLLYRANYELRTAARILQPFTQFKTKHENHLYKRIYEIDWTKYLDIDQTFAINGVTFSKYITHSQYLALKMKDAIVDQFRSRFGRRPNVNKVTPDVRFNIHLSHENMCSLSLDTSGDSLYKRGYRVDTIDAPINEALAAGMILLSGWDRNSDFIDPMCGSGTLPIEAAMYAYNIPAQAQRKSFAFEKFKNFDADLWKEVKETANANTREFKHKIIGYDKDFQAVRIAGRNVIAAHLEGKIDISRKQFEKLEPAEDGGVVIMNPPYDERLGMQDINAFYKTIGDLLKQHYAGYNVWIISSNMTAFKHVGLRPSRKITLYNGPLECKFMKYEMYKGSKKASKNKDK